MIIIVAIILWLAIGFASFAYWWTKDHDMDVSDAFFWLFVLSWIGPIVFIFGWMVHGKSSGVVLIRRRGK
ncbi:hypothetical protein KB681_gp51 [Burkholderia phage Mica]|uniref:Putative membrane protein n=1 Tax=Burkholderia phage Mica TaxID=2767579 RepID=A0A873WLW3_9CAUD|nr:hypothetical protein KB681_gp51 [Burkholderia phage Mica]QPB08661.1 putative membrane protein [Burkholderia phage Mica]